MNVLKNQCWDIALHESGLTYIFRMRAQKTKKYLKLTKTLSLLSVVVPGTIALNYSVDTWWAKTLLSFAIILSVLLTILSFIDLVYNREDSLNYYYESSAHHAELSRQFEFLAKETHLDENSFKVIFYQLLGEQKIRDQQDERTNLLPKEERMGLRFGLRQFQRVCVGCKSIPKSLESTNCDICGKF